MPSRVPFRDPSRSRVAAGVVTALATLAATATTALGLLATAPAAHAAPATDYEMPFPCAEQWKGTTRARHSPSRWAVDWNRVDDLGDPVVASAPGTVTTAQPRDAGGYGKYVVVDHAGGESTVYAHLRGVTVQRGQQVDQGALLGYLGSSGNSSGPHLHYEQRLDRRTQPAYFSGVPFSYGTTLASRNCLDVPFAANMAGDKRAELAVFRRQRTAQFIVQRPGKTPMVLRFGTATDEPIVGDWDGDGRHNPGVRVPGRREFRMRTPAGITSVVFGLASDRGIAGDWDGDGRWEIGVHRPRTGQFVLRAANGATTTFAFGDADDLPLTGDWNGDGATDVAVYDMATAVFTLRFEDPEGVVWTASVPYGRPGDLPVAGDWDGNGRTDVGVWSPSSAVFSRRVAATPTARNARTTVVRFGRPRR